MIKNNKLCDNKKHKKELVCIFLKNLVTLGEI